MIARQVLSLSPFVVVGVYVAIVLLFYLGAPVPIKTLQLCSVIWAFALYLVAQKVANEKSRLGRIVFAIAIVLIAVEMLVAGQANRADPVDPLFLLIPIVMAFSVLSMGLSVAALRRSERRSDWPLSLTSFLSLFAIFFLPVGIWFFRDRINALIGKT